MGIRPAKGATFPTSVPVVVIGAGACGLCAALAAKEGGTDAIVLERDDRPSGSTALSTGLIPAAHTRLQKSLGIDDSPEAFAADIIAKAKGQLDHAMAMTVARASGPTIDWLAERHGVAFRLVEGFLYPGHTRLRMHGTPNRTGSELEAALLAAVERAKVDIVTNALVTDLYAHEGGRIAGVVIRRPDGAEEALGCDALVLACNGFGGNRDMVREYIPEMAEADYQGHVGNTGDAVRWGLALGAAAADMGGYQGHGAVAYPHGNPIVWALLTEGGIQVNARGERFSNEVRGYSEQAVDVVNQPGRVAWNIYDVQREELALDFTDYREVKALGGVRQAPTVEALAEQIGVPANALAGTLSQVEALRAGNGSDQFGRDFTGKAPLRPPFLAVKVTGALFHTQGGLVVDAEARVLRTDGRPLPNLLAGGGAARGLSGPSRWGYLSGNGLLTATVLGRIAGTTASRMVATQ